MSERSSLVCRPHGIVICPNRLSRRLSAPGTWDNRSLWRRAFPRSARQGVFGPRLQAVCSARLEAKAAVHDDVHPEWVGDRDPLRHKPREQLKDFGKLIPIPSKCDDTNPPRIIPIL